MRNNSVAVTVQELHVADGVVEEFVNRSVRTLWSVALLFYTLLQGGSRLTRMLSRDHQW